MDAPVYGRQCWVERALKLAKPVRMARMIVNAFNPTYDMQSVGWDRF